MSRYLGSVCKQCRREGEKLFLKGERCVTKCVIDRKKSKQGPGKRGGFRKKMSNYAIHLREKQKARRLYGLTEEQFKIYFKRAEKLKGLTGDNLFRLLEMRLDNVVYRMGVATSRRSSRQIVGHGQIIVNDKRVNLPGYQMKAGDTIKIKEAFKNNELLKKTLERGEKNPSWLTFDKIKFSGTVVSVPTPEEFSHPINSQLIVELYSK